MKAILRLERNRMHGWCLALVLLLLAIPGWSCLQSSGGGDDVDGEDDGDISAPAVIGDLAVTQVTTSTVALRWTASGNSGHSGCAYEYDLRGWNAPITAQNFYEALRLMDAPVPLPAGMTQTYAVEGLDPDSTYFFALKVRNAAGLWSGLSNCVQATCLSDAAVAFADSALENVIRETIDKPAGEIHVSDLQALVDLRAAERGITDLTGIDACIALQYLDLVRNEISDLSPLAGMTTLRSLGLAENDILDLTPLEGLTQLEQLSLGQNPVNDAAPLAFLSGLQSLRLNSTQVRDFSPLYGLSSLTDLDLGSNLLGDISFVTHLPQVRAWTLNGEGLSDLAPLASMTAIEKLYVDVNQISDLTPLSGLTNIVELGLRYNQVEDLLPLVNNPGLGAGDVLWLRSNPLSQTSLDDYIPQLEARGVTVWP